MESLSSPISSEVGEGGTVKLAQEYPIASKQFSTDSSLLVITRMPRANDIVEADKQSHQQQAAGCEGMGSKQMTYKWVTLETVKQTLTTHTIEIPCSSEEWGNNYTIRTKSSLIARYILQCTL